MNEIADGVVRFESALWQTSSLLITHGARAIVVDPCISADELEAIASTAAELGARIEAQLVTHSDWDHVCGLYRFPAAPAVMSTRAAEDIASGRTAADVVSSGAAEGLSWPGSPRADLTFEPGEAIAAGPFTLETMALAGHTWCGAAYRLRESGVLAVGDYLSAIEFPFVYVSTAAYRATVTALIELLEHDPPSVVVPGHGPALSAAEARAIAHDDLAYLRELKRTVRTALDDGAEPTEAIALGAALTTPRGPAGDEGATLRHANAEHQLAELRTA